MARPFEHLADLSDDQRSLLRRAFEAGYFGVPREATLVELATEHDMTDREASAQIRRGLDVVVRDATRDGAAERHDADGHHDDAAELEIDD